MSCTSRRGLSVALAGAIAVAPFIGTAQASDASFRSIQYHADSQPVISCPLSVNAQGSVQALLCEVTLEPGEHVKDGLNAQAQLWDPHIVYSGDGVQTPHLVLKPDAIGDVANVIVTTNKRTYRLLFRSVPGSAPVYTTFHYDAEARLAARALHARIKRRQIDLLRCEAGIAGQDVGQGQPGADGGGDVADRNARAAHNRLATAKHVRVKHGHPARLLQQSCPRVVRLSDVRPGGRRSRHRP